LPADRLATFLQLKKEITTTLRPIVSPALQTISDVFHVVPETLSSRRPDAEDYRYIDRAAAVVDGEIFTDGQSLLVLTFSELPTRPRIRRLTGGSVPITEEETTTHRVQIGLIAPTWDSPSFDNILQLAARLLGTPLTPFTFSSSQFDQMKAEGRESPATPSPDEEAAIATISDRKTRMLVTAIKASGGLLIKDAPKQLASEGRADTQVVIERLKSSKLVDSEVVVVCAKSQAQVARAPSLEAVRALAAQGIKCACGRSIAEERIEEALSITELARGLLDKARWLTILLQKELHRMGVPIEAILVEQNVGGDEIDCLANVSGELVLFELKDKEFSLGNAYSFGAKIAVIRPEHPVIVTTEQVGNDAKEHFVRARLTGRSREPSRLRQEEPRTEIRYIEGISRIRPGLEEIVSAIYREDARRLLDEVLPLASVSGTSFLAAFEKMALGAA
jgi:hypothetical protein